jgi:hypothetical protein
VRDDEEFMYGFHQSIDEFGAAVCYDDLGGSVSTKHVVGVGSGDGDGILMSEGDQLDPMGGGTLDYEDMLVIVDGLREVGYEVEMYFGKGFVGDFMADSRDRMAYIAGFS